MNSDPDPQRQSVSSSADAHIPSQQELDLLFGPLHDEFFNAGLTAGVAQGALTNLVARKKKGRLSVTTPAVSNNALGTALRIMNAQLGETYVANDTLGLVPQQQKALDYANSDPDPQRQSVSSSTDAHVPSQQELDLLFGPLSIEGNFTALKPQTLEEAITITQRLMDQ
nr:hypothetical protein [Tanacetum cinerariifolium]